MSRIIVRRHAACGGCALHGRQIRFDGRARIALGLDDHGANKIPILYTRCRRAAPVSGFVFLSNPLSLNLLVSLASLTLKCNSAYQTIYKRLYNKLNVQRKEGLPSWAEIPPFLHNRSNHIRGYLKLDPLFQNKCLADC